MAHCAVWAALGPPHNLQWVSKAEAVKSGTRDSDAGLRF